MFFSVQIFLTVGWRGVLAVASRGRRPPHQRRPGALEAWKAAPTSARARAR